MEPGDASSELVEEALEPFKEQLNAYSQLVMEPEAKLYCMGLLKGIYDFANDSNTEFKDWAVDVPDASFTVILDDWRHRTKDRQVLSEMDEFLHKHCPSWTVDRKTKRR